MSGWYQLLMDTRRMAISGCHKWSSFTACCGLGCQWSSETRSCITGIEQSHCFAQSKARLHSSHRQSILCSWLSKATGADRIPSINEWRRELLGQRCGWNILQTTEGGANLATYVANTPAVDRCAFQIHQWILQHTQKTFDTGRNIARSIRTKKRRNEITRRK